MPKPRARGEPMATRKGKGAGWGGPAKGAGVPEPYIFDEAGPGRGHKSVEGEAKRTRNERRTEALEQFYWDVARGEAHDKNLPIRLSAASMLLNRLSPKDGAKDDPTVTIINNSLQRGDECLPEK